MDQVDQETLRTLKHNQSWSAYCGMLKLRRYIYLCVIHPEKSAAINVTFLAMISMLPSTSYLDSMARRISAMIFHMALIY